MKLVVMFNKGKQYQMGESRQGVLPDQPLLAVNPVEVVKVYIRRLKELDGNDTGFLFPAFASRKGVLTCLPRVASYESVLHQFKNFANKLGLEGSPADYGLHSFRRGAVTHSINNGCVDHVVMKQMRVASVSTVHRYATLSNDMLANAANKLFENC